MKALSIPIALLILLVLSISIFIPALILLNELGFFSSQGQIQGSVYRQQQDQQNNQIFRGNPNIYYNSSKLPYLEFTYNSIPVPLNITQIYYFNGTMWVPLLQQGGGLVISGNTKYPLPQAVFNKPIILISGLGNIYYLNPNTSIVTVNVAGPAGKIPVYIVAFVKNGSNLIPVSILVTLQSSTEGSQISGLTPQIFYLLPGTYLLNNVNGSLIYLSNYGLTATFMNWSLIGGGSLSAPNKLATQFVVYGPLIITAIFNASLKKFPVTIIPGGIPLGSSTTKNGNNGYKITLTSLNTSIPVYIDNKLYYINSSGIRLNLTYGYHIIQFPSQYNITYNFTATKVNNIFNVPYGQIDTFNFSKLTTNTQKISVIGSYQIFVNGSGTVYGNYNLTQTYYLVTVKNNFALPQGYTLVSNTSPVLGNIAGQLLQINNTYAWGPKKDYQPFKIYVKANAQYTVTYNYLNDIYGTFVLKKSSTTYTYYALLSYPQSVTIISYYSTQSYNYNCGTGACNPGSVNFTFTVDSPLIIINSHQWMYGGELP
ncbi:MAG: hypothetical protein QXL96_08310 [Ignisphaera sp.]